MCALTIVFNHTIVIQIIVPVGKQDLIQIAMYI